ncbi:efflux RND transporter periplasmic adaptor subunit [Nitratireductor sp. ZSWI3]|uniref:efflux RND transporter periplasmic adaptor subunit n=1 Tax=Nitratireductor sp. ZSWI3 TaxID=2966359 RepID=UPI00214FDA45|nr:efflux RND transporter periplasmic adaptor subunit [Nitratireductor sp. ZSWI3]MCR4264859.1 efflux RND transporter periplasmic adaptor subunit [Nitratireductor sp. ZSWI3]
MTKIAASRLLWGAGLTLVASISAGVLAMNTFHVQDAKAESAEAAPQAMPVSVAVVEPRDVTTWQEFSGRLEAVDRVQIRSRVAGAIQAVHFREGALVEEGDLLVSIDPAPYAAAVAQAEAVVAAAKARVELTRLELERGRKLAQNRTVSQSDLDQRLSAYHEAEASLRAAEAALQTAQLDLGYTQIRAPISGRVGKLEITGGNLVAAGAGSPVLTSLVSVDPIYASFSVGEDYVARALTELPARSSGARDLKQIPVEISVSQREPIRGELQFIDNEVDTASGTIRVRAVFDNAESQLIPGQFARVRLGQANARPELVISDRAIGTDQDKKFVFVVDGENKIAYRQVRLGPTAEGLRVVEDGLDAGERIVVNGLQRVRPGVLVAPQPVSMAPSGQAVAGADAASQ